MKKTGSLEILNAGEGDIRITFDTKDLTETIRAKRIITDMLRRGYALLVEVERDGEKRYERATGFDEANGCYIIADYDPQGTENTTHVQEDAQAEEAQGPEAGEPVTEPKRRGRPRKSVPMQSTTAVAVGRSAGG